MQFTKRQEKANPHIRDGNSFFVDRLIHKSIVRRVSCSFTTKAVLPSDHGAPSSSLNHFSSLLFDPPKWKSFFRTTKGRIIFKVCVFAPDFNFPPADDERVWHSGHSSRHDGEAASMRPRHFCLPADWQRYTDCGPHVVLLAVCVCVCVHMWYQ